MDTSLVSIQNTKKLSSYYTHLQTQNIFLVVLVPWPNPKVVDLMISV